MWVYVWVEVAVTKPTTWVWVGYRVPIGATHTHTQLVLKVDTRLGNHHPCSGLAVHALLDFLFLAQFPNQTSDTICCLEDSLLVFHNNKEVFIDLEIWENFNIPKLHSLSHYAQSIQLFRTTDNYNTEQLEHLHIDFAKDAYQATNCKDEYSQMTVWLEHQEKIQWHAAAIKWRQQHSESSP
jgi:hypothetical protein